MQFNTSFVTLLRDISRKDWNPPGSAFLSSVSMIKLSQCQEAVSLLYFLVTEINFPFFCRSAIFFPAFSTLCLFILGTSQS